jgi:dolichol-phosphate hexosyltransferase
VSSISILMPVFNERATVRQAAEQVLGADLPVESAQLVIVDDGSTDGSREVTDELASLGGVTVVHHHENRGKGAAIRTALRHAEGTYSAIMDADLEYDPNDIAQLLAPLMDGRADAVFGTRGFESHSAYSFWYVVGNKAVTLVANLLYNSWVSDIMTCHKVMETDLFKALDLREPGFGIEPEITARLLRRGTRIYEVPIQYTARSRDEGKKLTTSDGLRVLRTLARCRIR